MTPSNKQFALKFFRSDIRKVISFTLILAILHLSCSCFYKYTIEKDTSAAMIEKLKSSPNYLIIHQGDQAYHLAGVTVDQENQILTGTLIDLPREHMKYKDTKPKQGAPNRYSTNTKNATPDVINEVHFYVEGLTLNVDESTRIPISSIQRIEVYDTQVGATIATFLGSLLLVMIVIGVYVALTKSSCPFVYVHNGEDYVFAGEIYSGSIFRHLERDDYLLLPKTTTDSLNVIVANRLKEKQFINQLQLVEIKHPVGTQVLPDQHGVVHLIGNEIPLQSAYIGSEEVTSLLIKRDSMNFTFDADHQEDYFNDLIVTLPKPPGVREGHLIMRGKNSLWGDYVFGEFTKLFGHDYNRWVEQQNKNTKPVMENWAADNGLAMNISIKQDNAWQPVENVNMVGPLSFRDWVVPIDLSQHTGNTVTLKLRSGFMMWDMDYVAIDYSEDTELETRIIPPAIAVDQNGQDVLISLMSKDNLYLEQLRTGDEAYLQFPIRSAASYNWEYDYILHSRGYYNHIRDYTGEPNRIELLSFKDTGRFSRFSKEKTDELQQIFQHAIISASAN